MGEIEEAEAEGRRAGLNLWTTTPKRKLCAFDCTSRAVTMEKIEVDLTEVELILQDCTDRLEQLQGMDLDTLLSILAPFVASIIVMNTPDSQKARVTTDEFGIKLRQLVDRMIRDGISLPKAGFRGN
jgi:hypothetical protein